MEVKDDEEKQETKEGKQEGDDQSPGQKYALYALNDELNDKLKLLNYEEEYADLAPSYRTVSRDYFVKSTNVGEQFFIFTTLAAWLIRKAIDSTFAFPQEYDDPNATISNILGALRSKDVPVDFAPNKLKTGAGEQCLYVLDQLADLALISSQFTWKRAEPVPEDDEEVDVAVDQAEITAEEFEEAEQIDIAEDEDDGGGIIMDLHAMTSLGAADEQKEQPLEGILHSVTDVDAWKLEVERVAPQLKVTVKQDSKDWRMHLEQMNTLQKAMAELLNTAEPHLQSIANELDKTMERIASREKHLNNQLEPVLSKFRAGKDNMAELKEKYKEASGGILERTQILQRVSDELEQIKQQIDEKGLRNSDGAPMLRVKQALQKIESDIMTMDVQIGVIEQSLLQSQMKDRAAYNAYTQDLHI